MDIIELNKEPKYQKRLLQLLLKPLSSEKLFYNKKKEIKKLIL